jgi:predicted nucleic acid-binding protein
MSTLPPELAEPVERLRAKLVEINGSEQTCMTNIVASASQGKGLPEVQAVMARCRQASAAAAATAISTFRDECSEIGTQANSLAKAAVVAATAKDVSDFWAKSESSAAAFASEAAVLLPAQGPDKTVQAIKDLCGDRTSSINCYFEQLTT